MSSIWDSGAVMQWSAKVTEHAHYLDHADKCFRFNLAMWIASLLGLDAEHHNDEDNGDGEEHEPDGEARNLLLYYFPTRKVVNYFQVACALADNPPPSVPKSLRTFATSTTAVHLSLKPSLWMTILEASELFSLPDLHDTICRYCTWITVQPVNHLISWDDGKPLHLMLSSWIRCRSGRAFECNYGLGMTRTRGQ